MQSLCVVLLWFPPYQPTLTGHTVEELFSVATQQKAWDHFSKPQRKYISQWKDHVTVGWLLRGGLLC